MKIQSAGRLGNILFIWSYALNIALKENCDHVEIFADRHHSIIDEDLTDTFRKLSSDELKLKVDNKSGLILKTLDKMAQFMPNQIRFAQRSLRIQTEHIDSMTDKARIQRGYFQDAMHFEEIKIEVHRRLVEIIRETKFKSQLKKRFPFLVNEYQAVHVRLSDFIGSEGGVINLESQIQCLDIGIKTIICTDGTTAEVLSMTSQQDIEIITSRETNAWETIAILSGAKVLVTSNSTLSWWSGFIAAGNKNIVWVPKVWNKKQLNSKPIPFDNVLTYDPKFI